MFPCTSEDQRDTDCDAFVAVKMMDPSICTKHNIYKAANIPFIPIDDFIKAKVGVCRHLTLVNLYFLDRLSKDKDSPLYGGKAVQVRDNLQNEKGEPSGAHTWGAFVAKDGQIWHIDPRNMDFPLNLSDPIMAPIALEFLKKSLGAKAVENELKRLVPLVKKVTGK